MTGGEAVVARARAVLGVPFRLHGRDPASGLDCVGLALIAYGREMATPPYGLRTGMPAAMRWLEQAGLTPVETVRPGDLLLVRPWPLHAHLMIATDEGSVHAHAGLGRVVEMPGTTVWPVAGVWRDSAPPR